MDDSIILLYAIFIQPSLVFCVYFVGMLSKSLGQIIRVSASMHVLFHLDSMEPDEAIEAAIDFVEVCCQHAVYITGRGNIKEELTHLQSGMQCFMLLCYAVIPYNFEISTIIFTWQGLQLFHHLVQRKLLKVVLHHSLQRHLYFYSLEMS